VIVSSNNDFIQSLFGAIINVPNHRFSGKVSQWFSRKSGRSVTCWDYSKYFHLNREFCCCITPFWANSFPLCSLALTVPSGISNFFGYFLVRLTAWKYLRFKYLPNNRPGNSSQEKFKYSGTFLLVLVLPGSNASGPGHTLVLWALDRPFAGMRVRHWEGGLGNFSLFGKKLLWGLGNGDF